MSGTHKQPILEAVAEKIYEYVNKHGEDPKELRLTIQQRVQLQDELGDNRLASGFVRDPHGYSIMGLPVADIHENAITVTV